MKTNKNDLWSYVENNCIHIGRFHGENAIHLIIEYYKGEYNLWKKWEPGSKPVTVKNIQGAINKATILINEKFDNK